MLFGGIGTIEQRMFIALAAYATYVVNAAQFIWKLRAARLQAAAMRSSEAQATSETVPA
jgi:3-vinyl bacteriochlorophyllide hydratase